MEPIVSELMMIAMDMNINQLLNAKLQQFGAYDAASELIGIKLQTEIDVNIDGASQIWYQTMTEVLQGSGCPNASSRVVKVW